MRGTSGRGAVGSARGSGLRGRPFKSGRPDQKALLGVPIVKLPEVAKS